MATAEKNRARVEMVVDLEVVTCCAAGCGIQFAAPIVWVEKRRKDHGWFFCPNGHTQHFPAETEEERLRKQLAAAEGNAKYYQERARAQGKENAKLERSRAALRGVATRLRNKVGNGECPYCAKLFPDLAGHVAQCHPEIDPNDLGGVGA